MKYIEELHWILDNNRIDERERRIQNVNFVHSLGLKCDSVGWSILNLSEPHTDKMLNAINLFCKKNGWKARGVYKRIYIEQESDWYELTPIPFNYNTIDDIYMCKSSQGNDLEMRNIRAYHEIKAFPKKWKNSIFVPERFRNICISHNIKDIDFCWAIDKGKYEAEQYFNLYCINQIPNIIEFNYSDPTLINNILKKIKKRKERKILNVMDGSLPKLAKIFDTLQQINLPDCYLESDMPNCSIAHAYTHSTHSYCGRNKILIHKSFAKLLLEEKILPKSALSPALIVKEIPKGYTLKKTEKVHCPTSEYIKQSIVEYEKLKSIQRPTYMFTEKEALKVYKKAKNERKEDFKNPMSNTISSIVTETKYAPLVPFYLIANGGYLSDEYELLSYDKACIENNRFNEELKKEENLEDKIYGIVFATCGDGDRIFLCADGKVVRFNHEDFTIIEEWLNLSLFIIDTINN